MDNREVLIWLASIEGINNRIIEILENKFEQMSYVWYADAKEILMLSEINDKIKNQIIKHRNNLYYESLLKKIYSSNVKVITYYDDDYPSKLLHINGYPKVLYLKGNLLPEDHISIAIVGSRKSTAYGRLVAEKISSELSQLGVTLVSGMAKGIDTQVHQSALNNNTRTIAVLGSGVDVVYPSSNRELYYKIQENGCVISEFPLGTQPFSYNFPQRNRIISGLSLGVVVIEATEKSGSLITAHHATEQGRDVFAVPGNINSLYSRGTNLLIKDGAKLVMSVEDIIDEVPELNDKYLKTNNKKERLDYSQFSDAERNVIECLIENPIHCDLISYRTGIGIIELNGILTILEMKGIIRQLPGRVYAIM
ncbi:DNA processing protein [Proteiniborus ethanoligenes]|uniref:DNA processing protein n=1 Tax=Proteiniborus ethanoligenes TaxID=415015 RepID=A0A1H3PNH1_9FIRM|nr:DNA-processing protein DprA [Proteiniborus ethanoligenes]TAH63833.1 MAG: DNA-protecting protein DprA [Gottschalkiaceae bacterium]SDZ02578.1 DNA processing protein [Proteiniborus ethanoligenes]